MKMQAGIKYAYALELRPKREWPSPGFNLPIEQIQPTVEEIWAGINAMLMEMKLEYDLKHGMLMKEVEYKILNQFFVIVAIYFHAKMYFNLYFS